MRRLKTARRISGRVTAPRPANIQVTAFDLSLTQSLALDALKSGSCLSFIYDECPRIVEVHTVGLTTAGNPAMCAYQTDGFSNAGEVPDWRLFCFDRCTDSVITSIPSLGPRAEYRKGAKQFAVIFAEL